MQQHADHTRPMRRQDANVSADLLHIYRVDGDERHFYCKTCHRAMTTWAAVLQHHASKHSAPKQPFYRRCDYCNTEQTTAFGWLSHRGDCTRVPQAIRNKIKLTGLKCIARPETCTVRCAGIGMILHLKDAHQIYVDHLDDDFVARIEKAGLVELLADDVTRGLPQFEGLTRQFELSAQSNSERLIKLNETRLRVHHSDGEDLAAQRARNWREEEAARAAAAEAEERLPNERKQTSACRTQTPPLSLDRHTATTTLGPLLDDSPQHGDDQEQDGQEQEGSGPTGGSHPASADDCQDRDRSTQVSTADEADEVGAAAARLVRLCQTSVDDCLDLVHRVAVAYYLTIDAVEQIRDAFLRGLRAIRGGDADSDDPPSGDSADVTEPASGGHDGSDEEPQAKRRAVGSDEAFSSPPPSLAPPAASAHEGWTRFPPEDPFRFRGPAWSLVNVKPADRLPFMEAEGYYTFRVNQFCKNCTEWRLCSAHEALASNDNVDYVAKHVEAMKSAGYVMVECGGQGDCFYHSMLFLASIYNQELYSEWHDHDTFRKKTCANLLVVLCFLMFLTTLILYVSSFPTICL
jgi:hypothetical protein